MKPGIKSSEFAVTVGTIVAAVAGYVPPEWAAAVAAVYTIARSILKALDYQVVELEVEDEDAE